MQATKANLACDFAKVLGCKEKFVQTRLIVLGHGEVCGRCGGCGQYSYCPMYGTTCFGCSGSGKAVTKLTAKLLETVRQQVANGELVPYLASIKAAAERKAKVRGFMDRLMVAWEANPTIAAEKGLHFMDCSDRQHKINAICAPLYDEAAKLVRLIESGEWIKGNGYAVVSVERQTVALNRLDEILAVVAKAETMV